MRRLTFISLFLTLSISNLYSQEIQLKKTFFGYKFVQNNETIKMNQVYKSMKSNNQAYKLMKKAKSNNTISGIIGFVGGGMMGWPIGRSFAGEKFNWTLFGIGAGIAAISIPISGKSIKDTKKAIDIYNSSLNKTTQINHNLQLKIIANRNGIGLSVNF